MINEDELREHIRLRLQEMLDEMSSTNAIAGYLTPAAFRDNQKSNIKKLKKIATLFGFSLTPQGVTDLNTPASKLEIVKPRLGTLKESSYHNYKNDPDYTPRQKIGKAISEINKQLVEIQKIIKMNSRLKRETNLDSSTMWKRTLTGLVKLESKLLSLSQQIREIRN